ncbi:LamG-like jellyroll fold domain-containing protein [Hymenobacter antarcticus]
MKHFSFFNSWQTALGRGCRWAALLLAAPLATLAANPTLRIQALGSLSGNPDVTAFVDQVEIVRVSDGMVMAGAVANPGFETNGLAAGQFSYTTGGAAWTFNNRSGISRSGGGFGPTAPQGDAVAFLQSGSGIDGLAEQILTLADGVYQVRFLTAQRTNCCGGTYDQRLSVLINGTSVGMVQPPSATSFVTFTSNTFVVGSPNNALAFDGVNDIVRSTSNLPATSEFTLEGWVNPAAFSGSLDGFVLTDGFPTGAMHCQFYGNNLGFSIAGNNPTDVISASALPTGRWSHVAVVYSATAKTLRIYVNGVLNTSASYTTAIPIAALPYSLGGWFDGAGSQRFFNGRYDDVRMYSTALTQAQVQADMFSSTPTGAGLITAANCDQGIAGGNNTSITTLNGIGTLTNFARTGTTSNFVRSFPTITSLTPTSGPRGSSVLIAGTNLMDATEFKFNGTAVAPFTAPTDDFAATVTVPATATTGPVSTASATLTTFTGPAFAVVTDLVVSTGTQLSPTPIPAGTYFSITVTGTGNAVLAGNVSVTSSFTVQPGGGLSDGCSIISGAGSFTLGAGSILGICNAAGITSSGATGSVQVTGTRSFSTAANYGYNTAALVTGNGLPATVSSLAINTAGNVTLSNPVAVTAAVGVGGAGNLLLNGNGLTLLSSAAGTALARNSSTGVVVGTATVQRFISSANTGLGYRHYSAPVSGSTVSDLTTAGFTPEISQGDAYNASATPGTVSPFPTVFAYDQSRVTLANTYTPFDRGFVVPSASNPQIDLTLTVGRGYAVNIAGTRLVDFVGTLNTGPVTRTLARNAAGSVNESEAGWQLVGNPYPAPLDYSLVAPADRAGLDGAMYVFESASQFNGTYRSYVNGLPAANRFVGTAQGFFVRVSSGQNAGTLTFRNGQRVTDATLQVPFRRDAADARPLVQLDLRGATGAADAFYAYAETGATPAFDAAFDARKLPNTTGLNLASLASTGEALSIDGRPAFTAATVLPLTVGVPAAGTYTLTAAALTNLPAGLDAFLTDAATGQTINLSQQPTYAFSVSPTQAALLTSRFTLAFAARSVLATAQALTAANVTLYPNPAHEQFTVLVPAVAGATAVQAELLNALGQVVRRQSAPLAATGARFAVQTAGLAAGVYTLRLHAGGATLAKRVIVQ